MRTDSFSDLGLEAAARQLQASAIPPSAARINKLTMEERGLLFPYFDIQGRLTGFSRVRLSSGATGAKYVQPPGSGCHLYIPKNSLNRIKLLERETRVIVVEGEKKAISVAEVLPPGWASVAIGGVSSFWSGRKADRGDGTPIYTVFEAAGIPWLHERAMYVCFDSDKSTNIRVRESEAVLLQALRERGCEVYSLDVPVSHDGNKQGADDWIAEDGPGPFLDELFMARPKILAGVARPLGLPATVELDHPPSPPEFLVYPSIQVGANLWFGLPETMKSLTRNQVLIDLLSKKVRAFSEASPWEIRWDEPQKVLVICSEEPVEEFASGLYRCAMGNGLTHKEAARLARRIAFYSAPEYDLRLDRIIDAWDAADRPRLVFADHLLGLMPRRNFAGREVNAMADPQIITDTFLQVRMLFSREKTAFVCIAHTAKQNEGVFGSINWEASADTMTKFHREDSSDQMRPRIVLQPWKRRHSIHEPPFALVGRFDGEHGAQYRMDYAGPADVPSKTRRAGDEGRGDDDRAIADILLYVQENPGATYASMEDDPSVELRPKTIRRLCRRLQEEGLLFQVRVDNQEAKWFAAQPPVGEGEAA